MGRSSSELSRADRGEDRDQAMKAMMDDPSFKDMGKTMPVDGKRMFMGGFKVLQAF